jgi:hypothetical protein
VDSLPVLTDPRALSLERFAIRTRGHLSVRSAWRLAIVCCEGEGAIVCVDVDTSQTHFRGEGVFQGWPRERLEDAYLALRPRDEEQPLALNQLG